MPQLVTRIHAELAEAVDALVDAGMVESRSHAVRLGLEQLVDRHRRDEIGRQIVEGYTRMPQTEEELAGVDEAARAMILEEPW